MADRPLRLPLLFITVLVIAACGLVYELTAGALATYVLGDSVTQFSTVIGAYLSAMGLGAWLSRYLDRGLARRFVDVELAVAMLGGFSAPLLFLAFGRLTFFRPVLYAFVVGIGALVGLELPLLLRLLKRRVEFKELVARVLSVDYVGALLASLLFPVLLVPRLGLMRTSLAFGILNGAVALWTTYLLEDEIGRAGPLRARAYAVLLLLVAGFAGAERVNTLAEQALFADSVVFTEQSAYQRITVTRNHDHFQLYLDGNLQFASADEYRYHEALVHPAFAVAPHHTRVLVLGGGDGLATREILKYPDVAEVTLVDLDPEMTRIARELPWLTALNQNAFHDPRVHIINADAMAWLAENPRQFDIAIVDFPDPNNFSLGKLYTTRFYQLLRAHLAPEAVASIQSTTPLQARTAFWCVASTLEAAGFFVRPYHAFVPSFGEWGFMLAAQRPFAIPDHAQVSGLRYLSDALLPSLFVLGPDMARVDTEINRLNNQILVRYYEEEWKKIN
jgi:spermidine synthase